MRPPRLSVGCYSPTAHQPYSTTALHYSSPAQLRLQHGALGAQRGSARGSVVIPSLSLNILCYTVNLPSWYVEGGGGG